MPLKNGVELSLAIKENKPDIPIILLSSIGDDSRLKHPDLFFAVLNKPVRYQNLLNAVSSSLDLSPTFKKDITAPAITLDVAFAQQNPLAILVAEDTPINQKLIMAILNKLGYQPSVANNGKEVIEMVERQHYDVILMDVRMPVMDGLEPSRIIRKTGLHQPIIIAMTASAIAEDKQACISTGMDDYVSKPIDLKKIMVTLKQVYQKVNAA